MIMETIKTLAKGAVAVVTALPVSSLIKIGVLAGVTIFTAWVMIKRTKRMHKDADPKASSAKTYYSPVDDLLGKKNYASNPSAFDDMDPLAQDICAEMDMLCGIRPKKMSKKKRARIRKIQSEYDASPLEELKGFIKSTQKSWMDEVDEAARDLGLPVECYSCDDKITPEIREKYSMLF